jgi:5-formyltetrahydrofolate cyclo-ligase
MESKLQLYNRMMATRSELKAEFVEEASLAIQKRVLLMEEFRTALRVGLNAPFDNEVRTDLLFGEGNKHRKELYYPAVDEKHERLMFFRVLDLKDLKPGYAGIWEPTGMIRKLRDVNTLETIIVPGVAFDLHGGRLGFGKGFYDRCLLEFRGKRVALAYDFQIVSELPTAVRGQKVDWIVTESRMIHCLSR